MTDPRRPRAGEVLLWLLAGWWLFVASIPASPGSLIARVVSDYLPLSPVRALLCLLVVLPPIAFALRSPALRTAGLVGALGWWGFVWMLVIATEPTATTPGSYGLITALAAVEVVRGFRRG